MLSLPSQLLLRSAEHLESGNWAFINPTEAGVFNSLNNPNIVGLHQYHHHFSDCVKNANHSQHFAASFNKSEQGVDALDGVVIYLPKSKQQLHMLIANAACLVKANGVVLVVGENKAGIKSVPKLLSAIGENVNKIDSAKHCAVYAVTVAEPAKNFDIASYEVEREYIINDQPVKVMSLPGVFGHKQLDPGTELLLKQFTSQSTQSMKGELYDFACGTGVIGCYLLKVVNKYHSRLKVTMSDVSALAIYCAQQSAKLNGVSATIEACDGFIQQYKRFDHIVSNPPFHDGIKNDYSITENFIKQAYSASNPYATMTVVANRFLPYPDIFENVYKTFSEVAASNKYRVYSVTKPKK
ncbi:MAG: methyltransferase [Glaciecola sp.]